MLRACIAFFLLVGVLAQTFVLPRAAVFIAGDDPDLTSLVVPYVTLAVLGVLCAETVLIAMWALLGRVRRAAIFERRSLRWVDVIVAAGALATALTAVVVVHSWLSLPDGNLMITLAMVSIVLAGVMFVMLMIVMRALLVTATGLRSAMAEVI